MQRQPPLEEPTTLGSSSTLTIERRNTHSATCRWSIPNLAKPKGKQLWSKYFEVGGFDCRLLIYPKGDSQSLPGYVSLYLQITHPRSTKWDCFVSYKLTLNSVARDSWHRFSAKKKSHGWCDFTPVTAVTPGTVGVVVAEVLVLDECVERDGGKFNWRVRNFGLFREMIKTQKIMSPVFAAGECNLRISVYQSVVNGVECLSMCLESKDLDKVCGGGGSGSGERSCWCLFRMSLLNQVTGLSHVHRDSYGRFGADSKSGDNTSLGWNDFVKMEDFVNEESGFLVDDMAVFCASFHVVKELGSLSKNGALFGGRSGARKLDGHAGKFTWRIENFSRLKDILKKRKITGLCIKSRRFQIGNRDCRLIIYPRGQSQPPCHLSVFLEVTDSRNTSSDWTCFVSHRLSLVNQKNEEKSVAKESQNRYSKAAKDWGWREFVSLTSLFDQDSGFLLQDAVVFTAEVLILKETSVLQGLPYEETQCTASPVDRAKENISFSWKVENFLAFKEIMETRKIFSKFFQAGGCELRIGVYESYDTICIYLESDQSAGSDPEKNFWVKYRMAVVNQKYPHKTVWKESSICTKTWNNSVLQFLKVSDISDSDAGFLLRDTVVFVCEILDCCPWFDFADLEVLASDDDQDALTTDSDELIDSEDSEEISVDDDDIFKSLLSRAGFHLKHGGTSSCPQANLRQKLLMDAGAIAGFLTGLRVYLDDPAKMKRLLLPNKVSGTSDGKNVPRNDDSSTSFINVLMGIKVLQEAIVDLLLDVMVECCQPSEGNSVNESYKTSLYGCTTVTPLESDRNNGARRSEHVHINDRLDNSMDESTCLSSVQSSDACGVNISEKATRGRPVCPPETLVSGASENPLLRSKNKSPEQSMELLGLIISSLKALDEAVPQGNSRPRRRPQSAQKVALILDKAPKNLQPDLVALVPTLVEHSEHPLAAHALLDRLQKPDAEPSLRIPVFAALSQLECSTEVWERLLFQSFELLTDSNDEPLAATIDFLFKTASQCQHLPEAVRAVRVRLKKMGNGVALCVLDLLCRTVNSWGDVAETILRDIDCDNDFGENTSAFSRGLYLFGENGSSKRLLGVGEQAFRDCSHFSDIYILIEMLSIPCLAAEASQTFVRAVSRGVFMAQSMVIVLEQRLTQRLNINSRFIAKNYHHPEAVVEGDASDQLTSQQDDFTLVLGLAETLALSREPCVKFFAKMLYSILFKWYSDESYRGRILKRLVDRAIINTDGCHDLDLEFEILVLMASEEGETVRQVLSMIREVAEISIVDRAALWHQLCSSEDELVHIRDTRKVEISNLVQEKDVLSQKLCESEASNSRLKSEIGAEIDRFAREKKEFADQMQEIESQLEWHRAERDEEVARLAAEKKTLQDRLRDAETQLSHLKSRKNDELKKAVKDKNSLAERLKNAEFACKQLEEEINRCATENMTREEIRKSLEDEVQRLTQKIGQTECEKRDKEEQIARCEAYIDGMDSKFQACQKYIQTLEVSLHEEMSRHAPLYGAGLEALSMKELDTLAQIHEEGLRQVHALKQQRATSFLGTPHPLTHNQGVYPTASPSLTVGRSPSFFRNGVGIDNNGHVDGAVRPWFNDP